LRGAEADSPRTATWLAEHFATALKGTRLTLAVANGARRLFGAPLLASASAGLRSLSGNRLPQWTPAMPQPVKPIRFTPGGADDRPRVVDLATCLSRAMGPAFGHPEQTPLMAKSRALLEQAGDQVQFPEALDSLCCGQPFASKGYAEQGERNKRDTLDALLKASRGGLDPIYCDTSPCTL